jgi:hypothetical protein
MRAMMKRPRALCSAATGRIALAAIAVAAAASLANPSPVNAQSADLVLCDRLAADPSDPDKPADVKGASDVAPSDVATAIKYCRIAGGSSRRVTLPARPRLRRRRTNERCDRGLAQGGRQGLFLGDGRTRRALRHRLERRAR